MTYNLYTSLRIKKLTPLFGRYCKWLFLHLRSPISSSRYVFIISTNFAVSPLYALATNSRNGVTHN